MSDPTVSTMGAKLAALFPDLDQVATVSTPPKRRPPLRAVVAVGVVILALLVAILAGAFGSSGSGYRTAVASTQNVNAALSGVATIEPTVQATVAFPAAGTVASVGVKIGDQVSAGQTLAQLNTQSLQQTVDQQMATLAQDQLSLSNALSGKGGSTIGGGGSAGVGGSGSGTGTAGTGTATGTSWTTPSAGTSHIDLVSVRTVSNAQLAAAQQAVLAAQQQVDKAQSTAAGAVSAAVTACGADLSTPANQTACNTAVQTLNADETAVQNALSALSAASSNLNSIVNSLPSPSAPSGSGSGGGGSSAGGAARSGAGGAGGGGVSGGGSASPTAADLSADQAAVDAAFANVAVAQQALAQATLTTPIAGTVDAVNVVAGQTVSAGSSTATIVVQGSPTYQASTTVSVDNIPHVAVGQSATVVPDGKHKTLSGKVASISIAPNSTSSSLSTTYLVVIALKNGRVALGNASTGTVTITTQHAKNTLAVPTSAVTTNGSTNTVQVLDGSTVRQQKVKVGVVGYTWTQITSGLKQGEQVVLANTAAALPGSVTSSSNSSTATSTPFRGVFTGGGGGGRLGTRGG